MKRLSEIEGRLKDATPGPWYIDSRGDIVSKKALTLMPNNTKIVIGDPDYLNEHDAELIANAPTDIRDLLAVVKLQREALEQIKAEDEGFIEKWASEALEACDKILGNE